MRYINARVVLSCLSFFVACGSVAQPILDSDQREAVVEEIQATLDDYADAVTGKDIDAILRFWSDSQDFVFAGDGVILGGHDDWAEIAIQDNEQADYWVHWTWKNVHILPLSLDAASATLEFDYEKVLKSGENVKGYGSWTYVFRRTSDGWQVFHANGHHPVR